MTDNEVKDASGQKDSSDSSDAVGGISGGGFRLTGRELELLEFVLDQKFASIDALYPRFYEVGSSRSQRYAAERLQLLRKHGLICAHRVYTEPKLFYTTSPLGREILSGQRPGQALLDPILAIDHRTFEHDWRVTLCRAFRERSGHSHHWRSERRLKSEWAVFSKTLSREYMPDGIYQNRRGESVAFELELAPKTTDRYMRKITKFLDAMRHESGPFSRALFVCCSEPVLRTISKLTALYPDRFRVMAYSEIYTPQQNVVAPTPTANPLAQTAQGHSQSDLNEGKL